MSLKESPSALSKELSTAKAILREFNITVNGTIRHRDMVEVRAWHPSRGEIRFMCLTELVSAKYVATNILCAYTDRLEVVDTEEADNG